MQLATEREYSFFDDGRSAYTGDHVGEKGQLARFLRMVEEGKIEKGSYLLVESLDRLSREQVRVALTRFFAILDAGINIVTLTDPPKVFGHDSENELDIIIGVVMMSRAHEESRTKSERVGKAWKAKQAKARDGIAFRKTLPTWLRYEDGQYVEDTNRVATVKRIFQLAIDGYGKGKIAKILNADEVDSFKAGLGKISGTWGTSSVSKVLSNKAVMGIYQPKSSNKETGELEPHGKAIADFYPQIISPLTFNDARKAIESRRVSKATKQTPNFNALQGVIRCIHCGAAFHMTSKGLPPKGGKYFSCANNRKGTCGTPLVRLDHTEAVLPLILARIDSMSLVKESGTKLDADIKMTEAKLADEQEKLSEYQAMARVRLTATLNDFIGETEDEIARLETERERLLGERAAEDAMGFDTFMARLDLASRAGRNRANALLKRLEVLVYATRGEEARNPASSYIVTQDGAPLFGVVYANEKAGYRELSPWKRQRPWMVQRNNPDAPLPPLHISAATALKHASPVHYVAPQEAGSTAYEIEEDADQRRQAEADEDYWPIQE
ncbi:hypothetical protein AWV80_09585 [Cupriavidus sp. UYMU48A]|nr:hypothetical protein AWV80_09585 [Cupriavidus sp. UYMU48A]